MEKNSRNLKKNTLFNAREYWDEVITIKWLIEKNRKVLKKYLIFDKKSNEKKNWLFTKDKNKGYFLQLFDQEI